MPELTLKLLYFGLFAALLCAPIAGAQAPAPSPSPAWPPFDVVSIKPNNSGSGSTRVSTQSATFDATNVSLKSLLQSAYSVREELISGLTGTFNSASFDIHAKLLDPDLDTLKKLTPEQRNARTMSMIQQLLADRFHLKAHIETKELPVYELVVAKGGPTFKEAPPATADTDAPRTSGTPRRGGTSINRNGETAELTASAIPLANLADSLSYAVHRTVLDKTGLTGKYDLHLRWGRDDAPPPPENSTETPAPGIFTALQEQLGLKLQPAKGPTDTLVVDHVDMPTEN